MKSKEYWKKRFQQIEDAANSKARTNKQQWEELFMYAKSEIDEQINSWYQRFCDNNGIKMAQARKWLNSKELQELRWTVQQYIKHGKKNAQDGQWLKQLENASVRYHISRLEALKLNIQAQIEDVFALGKTSFFDCLSDVYSDTYYRTCFELSKGIGVGFNVANVTAAQINTVLSKPWAVNGVNFSSNLWENKTKLINTLNQQLSRMVLTGESPHKTINRISMVMESSKNNVSRLVMTEQAYFTTQSQQKAYDDLDVEQYEFVATLDGHTCKRCSPLDGKHWPVKDMTVGVNVAPIHPYCRCTSVPWFDDDFGMVGERAARDEDGNTVYIPGNMGYEEWKKEFVRDGGK